MKLSLTTALLLYAAIIALMVYCCMCASTEGSGPLAAATRFFCETIPSALQRCVRRAPGGARALDGGARLYRYVLYERNPLMQCFYLAVVLGAYGFFVCTGYPRLPCTYFAGWHRWSGLALLAACLASWHAACTVPAGIITPANRSRFARYECDEVLFASGRVCVTTGLLKPARSKYCKYMRGHVARFDHFCPWLNQTVGEENYRIFLGFLLLHVALLGYGALACLAILRSEVHDKQLFEVTFFNTKTRAEVKASWTIVAQYILFNEPNVCAVLVLCAVMCVVTAGFLGFHLWLVHRGMTTNEYYKWQDVRAYHKRLVKAYQSALDRAEEVAAECGSLSATTTSDGDHGVGAAAAAAGDGAADGALKNGGTKKAKATKKAKKNAEAAGTAREAAAADDDDGGGGGGGGGGDAAGGGDDTDEDEGEAGDWMDVFDGRAPEDAPDAALLALGDPGPFPQNSYDLGGLFRNLAEVIQPRSKRGAALYEKASPSSSSSSSSPPSPPSSPSRAARGKAGAATQQQQKSAATQQQQKKKKPGKGGKQH